MNRSNKPNVSCVVGTPETVQKRNFFFEKETHIKPAKKLLQNINLTQSNWKLFFFFDFFIQIGQTRQWNNPRNENIAKSESTNHPDEMMVIIGFVFERYFDAQQKGEHWAETG